MISQRSFFIFDLELTSNLKEAEQGTQHIIAIIHDLIFQRFIIIKKKHLFSEKSLELICAVIFLKKIQDKTNKQFCVEVSLPAIFFFNLDMVHETRVESLCQQGGTKNLCLGAEVKNYHINF